MTYANPKNKAKARSIRNIVSAFSLPNVSPTLDLGMVCALSTITWDGFRKWFNSSGTMSMRNSVYPVFHWSQEGL